MPTLFDPDPDFDLIRATLRQVSPNEIPADVSLEKIQNRMRLREMGMEMMASSLRASRRGLLITAALWVFSLLIQTAHFVLKH